MNLSPVEVVVALLWRGKSVLVQQRPLNKSFGGYWEFPGGKVELNESLGQAITREIKEELGVEIKELSFWKKDFHNYAEKNLKVNLHYFDILKFEGEPRGLEGQNICWIQIGTNTQDMKFLEADIKTVEEVKQKIQQMD